MAGPLISNYGLGTAKYHGVLAPNAAYQAGIEAVLNQYKQEMENIVNLSTPAFDIFGKNKFPFVGERIIVPMKIANPGSFSAGSEYSVLPRGSGSKYQEMQAIETYLWAQMEITKGALSKAKGKGAIIDLLDSETRGTAETFAFNLQRQLWGDGVGYLCRQSGAVVGADPYTITIYTTGAGIPHNTSRLMENATVRWGANAGELQATTNTRWGVIRDITDDDEFIVDMSGYGTTAPVADDYFVMGDDNATSYALEFMGFGGFLDNTATIQGLAPATFSWWKSGVKDYQVGAVDVPLQDEYLNRGCALHQRRSKSNPDVIFAHDSMEPEIYRALVSDRRFVNKGDYKMGYSSLGYQFRGQNIDIVYDCMAPRNSLTLVNKGAFKYAEQEPMGWMLEEFSHGMFRPSTAGKPSGLATYGMIGQFVTMNRRAVTALTGFSATVDWSD